MDDARCNRRARPASGGSLIRRSSATCPAVLHRHSATENRVTGATQSRPSRSESSVSLSPNPRGLTTPAATTATRAGELFPFPAVVLSILGKKNWTHDFLLLS